MWLVSVSYLGTLYLLAYVSEKPSGFGVLSYPPPSLSYSVGSLGNALFCGCTQACVTVPHVSEKRCSFSLTRSSLPNRANYPIPRILRQREIMDTPRWDPSPNATQLLTAGKPLSSEGPWADFQWGLPRSPGPWGIAGCGEGLVLWAEEELLSPGGLDSLGRPRVLALHGFAWGPVVKCYRFQQINADLSKRSPAAGPECCVTALCVFAK